MGLLLFLVLLEEEKVLMQQMAREKWGGLSGVSRGERGNNFPDFSFKGLN
jgi:hypothetical protein